MPHCQTFLEKLHQNGYRITPQREMIVEAVAHSPSHISAEDIYEIVQKRSHALNLATVYRTLDLLVDTGLISRIHLGSGRVLYASDQHGPHLHLICRQCGETVGVDASVLTLVEDQLQTNYGFTADIQHLCLSGLCKSCQTTQQNA